MGRIILVLLSDIDEDILEVLKQSLQQTFGRQVDVRSEIQSLDYAYDPEREQYKSPRMLSRLRRLKKGADDKILGVVDVDLYSPGFEFVFGEADIASSIATVSFHRLNPERYGLRPNAKLLGERAVKEAVHELGHLYQLGHCPNPKCVMHFSTSLKDTDVKGASFCAECQQRLGKKSAQL